MTPTHTHSTPSAPVDARRTVSTSRILTAALSFGSLIYLTPIHPLAWAWVAITAAAAALPEGRTASIVRKVLLALALLGIVLCVLAVAAFFLMLTAGGAQIG